jgi:DNA-binding response OmpR family regulator
LGYLVDPALRLIRFSRAETTSQHVWGHESASDGNLIEAAVSTIRRKLGEHAGLVETVRGVGYRWREP